MATHFILDTHALLWFLAGDPRLGAQAKAVLEDPTSHLVLPAIALAEACWIIERGKVPLSIADLMTALDKDKGIVILPLDRAIIATTLRLTQIGEMHDRQILATALGLSERGEPVALLTKDANLMASGLVPVMW